MTKLHAQVLFGEDIRQEADNKFSLMGIYRGAVLLEKEPPVRLSKLAVVPILTLIGTKDGDGVQITGRASWRTADKPVFTANFIFTLKEGTTQGANDKISNTPGEILIPGFLIKEVGHLVVTAKLNTGRENEIGRLSFVRNQP